MNDGGKSVKLFSVVDALLMTSAGGGKHCAAKRQVLGVHFILWGGVWCGAVEL
jgi:hypothetical protein